MPCAACCDSSRPRADKLKEAGALYTAPVERGRDARFRIEVVVVAYKHTCALTGYRMTTLDMESIVDAAHIHEFSDSRNNDPRNGLALSKNAHWQFDRGLWSITDEYRVIVNPREDSSRKAYRARSSPTSRATGFSFPAIRNIGLSRPTWRGIERTS